MVDLPHDRAHPEKRHRPFAAGIIPVSHGAIFFLFVVALSLALSFLLPPAFLVALAGYFCLSLSYSLYLKRKLMVDVVALAALYGIRVLAGSAVTGIVLSQWLVGFCFFIFLSLALMKRTTEIIQLPEANDDNSQGKGLPPCRSSGPQCPYRGIRLRRRPGSRALHKFSRCDGFVSTAGLALGHLHCFGVLAGARLFSHRPRRNAARSCHFRSDRSQQLADRTAHRPALHRRHLIAIEFEKAPGHSRPPDVVSREMKSGAVPSCAKAIFSSAFFSSPFRC